MGHKGMVNIGEALDAAQPVEVLLEDKIKLEREIANIEEQLRTSKVNRHKTDTWRPNAEYALSKKRGNLLRIESVLSVRVQSELGNRFMAAARGQLDPNVFNTILAAAKS